MISKKINIINSNLNNKQITTKIISSFMLVDGSLIKFYSMYFKGICFGNLYLFLFLCLILIFGLNSCDTEKPTESFDSKIRTETVWDIEINSNINKTIVYIKTFDKNGNLINVINYDKAGIKIEESQFYYNGRNSEETKLIFDKNGNISEKEQIKSLYDANGRVSSKELIKNNDTTNKTKQDFTYDNLGNVIKIIENKSSIITEKKFTYSFDNVGKISEIVYAPDNLQLEKRDSLVYNSEENYIKMFSIDNNGKIESSIKYKYNKLGKITNTLFYDKDNTIIKSYKHIYTYY